MIYRQKWARHLPITGQRRSWLRHTLFVKSPEDPHLDPQDHTQMLTIPIAFVNTKNNSNQVIDATIRWQWQFQVWYWHSSKQNYQIIVLYILSRIYWPSEILLITDKTYLITYPNIYLPFQIWPQHPFPQHHSLTNEPPHSLDPDRPLLQPRIQWRNQMLLINHPRPWHLLGKGRSTPSGIDQDQMLWESWCQRTHITQSQRRRFWLLCG